MKEIGQFFNKFNSSAVRELRKREIICEIVKKITNQAISFEDISIVNKTIKIKGSSGLKSQILIRKRALLQALAKKLPNLIVVDIQ